MNETTLHVQREEIDILERVPTRLQKVSWNFYNIVWITCKRLWYGCVNVTCTISYRIGIYSLNTFSRMTHLLRHALKLRSQLHAQRGYSCTCDTDGHILSIKFNFNSVAECSGLPKSSLKCLDSPCQQRFQCEGNCAVAPTRASRHRKWA